MFFKDKFGNDYKCDFDFKNCDTLVLSGGAMKCIYFLGALCRIKNVKFKNYAGTSCGAIISCLLAVGYSPIDVFKLIYKQKDCGGISKLLDSMVCTVNELFVRKGFDPAVTFKGLYELTGNTLAFVATNVSKLREEIFYYGSHPDTPVITAMRLSCSLPIIFPVAKFNNDIFVDGIFFDNFPLKLSRIFQERKGVVGITTSNSHYDRRVEEYYAYPETYKIIMVPDKLQKYFCLTKDDKFYMFMTGFNYVDENKCSATKISDKRRRKTSV